MSVLVRVDDLLPCRAELLGHIAALSPRIEITDDEVGAALAYALLFEYWPELVELDMDATRALYNRYFWFRRYSSLAEAKFGSDAGLEQQALQILEHAEIDLDWTLLGDLDRQARAGYTP